MTNVFIDESAAHSVSLIQDLFALAQTANLGDGVYQVAADVDTVTEVTMQYPMVVFKVEEA